MFKTRCRSLHRGPNCHFNGGSHQVTGSDPRHHGHHGRTNQRRTERRQHRRTKRSNLELEFGSELHELLSNEHELLLQLTEKFRRLSDETALRTRNSLRFLRKFHKTQLRFRLKSELFRSSARTTSRNRQQQGGKFCNQGNCGTCPLTGTLSRFRRHW